MRDARAPIRAATDRPITKAGPANARRRVVEAAWHYRHRPAVAAALAARQVGVDPQVVAIAARAQRRLHERVQRERHTGAARAFSPAKTGVLVYRTSSM